MDKMKSARVFVSVGTHPQQFDRLLRHIDFLVSGGKLKGRVFAQIGHGSYAPKKYESRGFLTLDEFEAAISKCKIFITHAGEGNIGQAKNLGKKMVVVPRRKEFGEHTNDHQLELAEVVEGKKLGLVAWNIDELAEKLAELGGFRPASVPKGNIENIVEGFLQKEFR